MTLLVYKSSAGSGKTSTLVSEYLKITLKDPQVFRNVLAITFTNKAANEMKDRILDALVKLSEGQAQNFGELTDLPAKTGLDEFQLSQRASRLLTLILHNYDEFAVSTIDSFVHRIVRTFSSDVKLPHNFEVVIDNEEIIPEIIEKLYEKVDTKSDFTALMVDFVMKQVEDEQNYDPTWALNRFIKQQLNEESHFYLKKIEHISLNDFMKIIQKINSLYSEKKQFLQQTGSDAMSLITQNGLEAGAFYQVEKGIFGYFKKLAEFMNNKATDVNSYVEKTINGEVNWYSSRASLSDKNTIDAIKDDLVLMFHESRKVVHEYWLYSLLYEKIYQLALMREIRSLFTQHTEQTQRVHISEFNKKISDEISGQPVPFIYERLGRKYQHFLIDEFQDTSMLQWQNLLPLLEESLASNNLNMLVGDTKQAIYRFRNGEVELFARLPEIYKNDGSQLMKERENILQISFSEITLDENFRSKSEIIQFNNAFFQSVKNSSTKWIQDIYKNHQQILPEKSDKTGGYVSVEFVEAENAATYREKRLKNILEYVEKMLAAGIVGKEICVLSRSNENASEVATFLMNHGHKVISPESLLLSNSPKIRLIISFLYLLTGSKQKIYFAEFLNNFLLIKGKSADFHNVYTKLKNYGLTNLDELLVELHTGLLVDEFSGLSVYEMVELLIRNLNFNREQDAFLLNFLDFVYENQEQGMGRLDVFLETWESKKSKTSLVTSSGEDAISVMTIHKSKGLKFNNVIVDITSGNNQKGKTEFWTNFRSEELPELEIALFPLKKDIEQAGMGDFYLEEDDKTKLDFINLVYVSFTRAVNSLFIVSHLKEKNQNTLTQELILFLEKKQMWEEGKYLYQFGELKALESKQVKDNKTRTDCDEFISTDWKELVTVAHSDEVVWDLLDEKPAKSYGNLVHQIMALVYTRDDVKPAIQSYINAGKVDDKEGAEIQDLLFEIVGHPGLKDYFDAGKVIKTECSIIDKYGNLLRPDRVIVSGNSVHIIDYKTGEKLDNHVKQIKKYGEVFLSLGYQKISTKLVYVNEGVELVEVY